MQTIRWLFIPTPQLQLRQRSIRPTRPSMCHIATTTLPCPSVASSLSLFTSLCLLLLLSGIVTAPATSCHLPPAPLICLGVWVYDLQPVSISLSEFSFSVKIKKAIVQYCAKVKASPHFFNSSLEITLVEEKIQNYFISIKLCYL